MREYVNAMVLKWLQRHNRYYGSRAHLAPTLLAGLGLAVAEHSVSTGVYKQMPNTLKHSDEVGTQASQRPCCSKFAGELLLDDTAQECKSISRANQT